MLSIITYIVFSNILVINLLHLYNAMLQFSSVQSLSRVRLCDLMNPSTPGLPVHHQLPEFTQSHVHRVSDAIQPSHPLSSPSPLAPNPSQHQSLFRWVNCLHEVAKVLEFHLQHHSLQRNPRADLLQNGLVGSPCSPRHCNIYVYINLILYNLFSLWISMATSGIGLLYICDSVFFFPFVWNDYSFSLSFNKSFLLICENSLYILTVYSLLVMCHILFHWNLSLYFRLYGFW